jgi:hypothetical protein
MLKKKEGEEEGKMLSSMYGTQMAPDHKRFPGLAGLTLVCQIQPSGSSSSQGLYLQGPFGELEVNRASFVWSACWRWFSRVGHATAPAPRGSI